jgi:hypothetical protein
VAAPEHEHLGPAAGYLDGQYAGGQVAAEPVRQAREVAPGQRLGGWLPWMR